MVQKEKKNTKIKFFLSIVILLSFLVVLSFSSFSQIITTEKYEIDSIKVKVPKAKPTGFIENILYKLSSKRRTTEENLIYYKKDVGNYDTLYIGKTDSVKIDKDLFKVNTYSESYQNQQLSQYSSKKNNTEDDWDKVQSTKIIHQKGGPDSLTHMVYGFHPYWLGRSYLSYNYSLLSRIAYFSYNIDPETGAPLSIGNWNTTAMIDIAQQHNCNVDLCATNFGMQNNDKFLSNNEAQSNFNNEIINYLKQRQANGVNINFESIPKNKRIEFTNFVINVKIALYNSNPNYKLSLTIPAIDYLGVYNIPELIDYVDYFIMMGYDFYGRTSANAGPNSLISGGSVWSQNNIDYAINYYLNEGIPNEKFILALPYYGKEWITKDKNIPSKALKYVSTFTYAEIANKYSSKYISYLDTISFSSFISYNDNGIWKQCWFDDEYSLRYKYDYVKAKQIAGIGIWALGYDNGYTQLWDLLKEKFTKRGSQYDTNLFDTNWQILGPNFNLKNSPIEAQTDNILINSKYKNDAIKGKVLKILGISALIISILFIFTTIGFIISLFDYNVREVIFSMDFRVYSLFILLGILFLIILNAFNKINQIQTILIAGVALGVIFTILFINIKKNKKVNNIVKKP